MKVWMGYYYENSNEWFAVWANDKRDAWDKVDELGSPDDGSTREVGTPGLVNFHIDYNEHGHPIFSPSKVEARRKNWLCLGTVGCAEEATEYIKRLRSEKESSDKFLMKVWLGRYLPKPKKLPLEEEECFIVWAKNKKEALQHVETIQGNVDKEHPLFEITESGFINFHVTAKGGTIAWVPPKDDLKNSTWINLPDIFMTDDKEVFEPSDGKDFESLNP